MDKPCRVDLFGGLRVIQGERVTSRFRTRKTAELLAYLVYFHRRAHPRDILIDLLWPENDTDTGRHNLSMALSFLRQQIDWDSAPDGSLLIKDRNEVRINGDFVGSDIADFEAAITSGLAAKSPTERVTLLTRAADLYRGELLPGFYSDWVFPEQQRTDEMYVQALRSLTFEYERDGDIEQSVRVATQAVSANPQCEESQRTLIRLYAIAGRSDAALRQYDLLERMLRQDVGSDPSSETLDLIGAIRSGSVFLPHAGCAAGPGCKRRVQKSENLPIPNTALAARNEQLEPVGGALGLRSAFYISRSADAQFAAAIDRRDSIVLVKGARQVGKSSLLARALDHARAGGCRIVLTNLLVLNAQQLESVDAFWLAMAHMIADQLDIDASPSVHWNSDRGSNANFRRYLRKAVLPAVSGPLVWALDEVDRLLSVSYSDEIFALFRSWHDERALDPDGPWAALTLAMAYSTEAHLFITDLNQSPFNVGTRLILGDFSRGDIVDLNRRYGFPLKGDAEIERFVAVVGGHPYLVQRGLREMVASGTQVVPFESLAYSENWVYADHLSRIAAILLRQSDLLEAVRDILRGRQDTDMDRIFRLRSAGILAGRGGKPAEFRCKLYEVYLRRRLL